MRPSLTLVKIMQRFHLPKIIQKKQFGCILFPDVGLESPSLYIVRFFILTTYYNSSFFFAASFSVSVKIYVKHLLEDAEQGSSSSGKFPSQVQFIR